mmetsp:Transcript_8195/g.22793  ORF Transcript_8195/g.22793 Transcript_8195/m.22793 type:complete len:87 (+) Transcript_8195:214-474(+)
MTSGGHAHTNHRPDLSPASGSMACHTLRAVTLRELFLLKTFLATSMAKEVAEEVLGRPQYGPSMTPSWTGDKPDGWRSTVSCRSSS